MESVYIDTTIPSYYFEEREDPVVQARHLLTVSWWDGPRVLYETVTSLFTLEELSSGEYPGQQKCLRLVEHLPLLGMPGELKDLIGVYIDNKLMPAEETGDAAHLAMASLHKLDYLVTWNLKHLANVNKIRHMRVLNTRLGIWTPQIVTPEYFLEGD